MERFLQAMFDVSAPVVISDDDTEIASPNFEKKFQSFTSTNWSSHAQVCANVRSEMQEQDISIGGNFRAKFQKMRI